MWRSCHASAALRVQSVMSATKRITPQKPMRSVLIESADRTFVFACRIRIRQPQSSRRLLDGHPTVINNGRQDIAAAVDREERGGAERPRDKQRDEDAENEGGNVNGFGGADRVHAAQKRT
jgi:hypothetical protein